MDFPTWFETKYQRTGEGESRSRAIQRLALEAGIGWTTVLRALQGTRIQRGSAQALAAVSRGRVKAKDLAGAPTRAEIASSKAG